MEVHNWGLQVGNVQIDAITSSSVFLVGDSEDIILSSFFDTPPEATMIGSIVPLSG
ncbi:spore germination protein PD [Virgibacillus litoralis]|nr:spore germination protein PD [Virgibacillus litoralis]